jgi:hypothetical protein
MISSHFKRRSDRWQDDRTFKLSGCHRHFSPQMGFSSFFMSPSRPISSLRFHRAIHLSCEIHWEKGEEWILTQSQLLDHRRILEDNRIGELDFLHFSNVDIIDLSKGFVNDQDEAFLCGNYRRNNSWEFRSGIARKSGFWSRARISRPVITILSRWRSNSWNGKLGAQTRIRETWSPKSWSETWSDSGVERAECRPNNINEFNYWRFRIRSVFE